MRKDLIVVALTLLPVSALAQEGARVTVTDTLTTEFRTDNKNGRDDDDDFGLQINRLNITGVAGDISTQLRVDSVYFPDETLFLPNPPSDAFRDDVRIERLTVRYKLGDWTLTAGDFYRQVGRGIALSLRKVDEAGVDVVLRGGQMGFEGDEHKAALFVGQTNPTNLDTVNQAFIEDVDDIVVGGDYEFSGIDGLTLGSYVVFLQPEERLLPGQRDFTVSDGIYAELPDITDWMSIYLELGTQRTQLAGAVSTGRGFGDTILANAFAAYSAIDLNFYEVGPGDVIFLIELLVLDDYEVKGSRNTSLGSRFAYNFAPTLERIDQEVFDNSDVRGGRIKLEYALPDPELVFFANAMLRINNLGDPSEVQMFHGYAGFEFFFQEGASRLQASGGHREEHNTEGLFKAIDHVEVDYNQHLSGNYSAHVTSNVDFRLLDETNFTRGSTFVGLDRTGTGGLTFEFGYDTQDPSPEVRNIFFAGILVLDAASVFDMTSMTGLELRATVGTQRGGIKCISGVCREFPAFAGGRLEVIGRF